MCLNPAFFLSSRAKKSKKTYLTSSTGKQMAVTVWRQVCHYHLLPLGLGGTGSDRGWGFVEILKLNFRVM